VGREEPPARRAAVAGQVLDFLGGEDLAADRFALVLGMESDSYAQRQEKPKKTFHAKPPDSSEAGFYFRGDTLTIPVEEYQLKQKTIRRNENYVAIAWKMQGLSV
jgi:hypothetical protein